MEDTLNLPEGAVTVRTPARLSKQSAEDLADFLELVLRQVQRSAEEPALNGAKESMSW